MDLLAATSSDLTRERALLNGAPFFMSGPVCSDVGLCVASHIKRYHETGKASKNLLPDAKTAPFMATSAVPCVKKASASSIWHMAG